jgi:hypothetical protein
MNRSKDPRAGYYMDILVYKEELLCLVKDKKIHEARAFNFTYRHIDDALSINANLLIALVQ